MAFPQDRLPFDLDLRFPRANPTEPHLMPVFERATAALLRRVLEEFEPDWVRRHDLSAGPASLPASARWVHEAAWTVAGWPTHIEPHGPLRLTPWTLLPFLTCPQGRHIPLNFVDLGPGDTQPTLAFQNALRGEDASSWTHHLRVGHIAGIRPHAWEAGMRHPLALDATVPACLVDLVLFAAEHARALIALERPALILLPSPVDTHRARLWHDLLTFLEDQTGIAYGELRVIMPLADEPDERLLDPTLFELRDRLCAVLDPSTGHDPGRLHAVGSRVMHLLARRGVPRLVPDAQAPTRP